MEQQARPRDRQEDVCNVTPIVATSPKGASRSEILSMLLSSGIDWRRQWQWTQPDLFRPRNANQKNRPDQDNLREVWPSSHPPVSKEPNLPPQTPSKGTVYVMEGEIPPSPQQSSQTPVVAGQQIVSERIETSVQPVLAQVNGEAPADSSPKLAVPKTSTSSNDEDKSATFVPRNPQGRYEELVEMTGDNPVEAEETPRPDGETPETCQLLKRFRRSELGLGPKGPFRIGNEKTLVSYSWDKDDAQTIVVPGIPPRMKDRRSPQKSIREATNGKIERLEEQKRWRSMSALFAALETWDPEASGVLADADLIADAKAIGNMLDFVRHVRQGVDTWQIQIELVHGTLMLGDCWSDDEPPFDQAAELARTVAHDFLSNQRYWRVVSYDIGAMKWLVRSNAEQWFEENPEKGRLCARAVERSPTSKANITVVPELKAIREHCEIEPKSLVAITDPTFRGASHQYVSYDATGISNTRNHCYSRWKMHPTDTSKWHGSSKSTKSVVHIYMRVKSSDIRCLIRNMPSGSWSTNGRFDACSS
ncbi:hypothetical protein DL98DRAFT_541117 [Cadophora sp. DSE1049]|nr:hypothetical protein DL98DRAFT_541117 [Cadophora sp. DSE1049]